MIIKEIFRRIYYLNSILRFKKYGKNLWFGKGGVFIRPEEIVFGNNIFVGRNFHISARNLFFGNDIMIGPNLVIECDNHTFDKVGKFMFEVRDDRIIGTTTIENDVWIGANVTILPNVKICEGSIIGAGSIVTKDVSPYTIVVGNPARPIKRRFSHVILRQHLDLTKSKYSFTDISLIWEKDGLIN